MGSNRIDTPTNIHYRFYLYNFVVSNKNVMSKDNVSFPLLYRMNLNTIDKAMLFLLPKLWWSVV